MQVLREIIAEPLTQERFAPFGDVLESAGKSTRQSFNAALENARADAGIDLSIASLEPVEALPLVVNMMERHPHSSQTFIPMKAGRYLVIVAPGGENDRPDMDRVRVFVAEHSQGITYKRGVWHHGMTVLEGPAVMAILMWCDGGDSDEEFVDVEATFSITVADAS